MQVLVYNGPWDLTVESREDPMPGHQEVLVRVVATGVCGSDIHGFTGENGRRVPGQVMGHETVGRVEALGPGVDVGRGLQPGAPVTVNPLIACGACRACRSGTEQSCPTRQVIGVNKEIVSAFAGLLLVPAPNVVPLPETMPIEYGALIEPLSVGYHAARRGACSSSDTVLVIGGGPIGQACILAAQRLGARDIVVSEPNRTRRTLAASLGATGVDPASEGFAGQVEEGLGGPATLALDAVGSSASLQSAIDGTAFGARVVLVGMNAPRVELPAYSISTEERTLVGSFCYPAQEFRETAQWVGTAPEVLARLIDGRVDMDGAPDAFTELAKGESPASKVLVFPGGVPTPAGRA